MNLSKLPDEILGEIGLYLLREEFAEFESFMEEITFLRYEVKRCHQETDQLEEVTKMDMETMIYNIREMIKCIKEELRNNVQDYNPLFQVGKIDERVEQYFCNTFMMQIERSIVYHLMEPLSDWMIQRFVERNPGVTTIDLTYEDLKWSLEHPDLIQKRFRNQFGRLDTYRIEYPPIDLDYAHVDDFLES